MPIIKAIKGISPKIDKSCFIAENATIVGQVELKKEVSIWYGAIIRGDVNEIKIGKHTNIQDGAIIHCTYKKFATHIGENVSIGHKAIVHGCTIHDNVLIGMGAIVMDGVIVGKHSIIAAGSVVKEGTVIEPESLYAGNPAVFKKKLDSKNIDELTETLSKNYILYSSWQ